MRNAPDNVIAALDHYLEDLDVIQKEVQDALAMQQLGPANATGPTNQVSEPFSPGE